MPTRETVTAAGGEHRFQCGARGLRFGKLLGAVRVQLRRVDVAQPHFGADIEPRPHLHARLEGVAVDDADDLSGITELRIELPQWCQR